MRILTASALAACCAVASLAAFGHSEPLQITNLSPLASLRAIPSQRSAEPARGLSWAASATLSNHFTVENRGEESLFLDGQTDALTLSVPLRLAKTVGRGGDRAMAPSLRRLYRQPHFKLAPFFRATRWQSR